MLKFLGCAVGEYFSTHCHNNTKQKRTQVASDIMRSRLNFTQPLSYVLYKVSNNSISRASWYRGLALGVTHGICVGLIIYRTVTGIVKTRVRPRLL